MTGSRVRLFVGIPVPSACLDVIAGAQARLPAEGEWRAVPPKRLHVTLAFIGEVAADRVAVARACLTPLEGATSGVATMSGLALLPKPRAARVVAVTFADDHGILDRLHEEVVGRLEEAGFTAREARPFRAHLTIARCRRPTDIGPRSDMPEIPFAVESLRLYRSTLGASGPTYDVLEEIGLASSDPLPGRKSEEE